MAGRQKSKMKSSTPFLPSPAYSIANTSASLSGTTTTTVNKAPVLTTIASGGPNNNNNNRTYSSLNNNNDHRHQSNDKNISYKSESNSISYFDSISSINKRIGESGTNSSAFDFEELSAILNGESTDVNSCFSNSNVTNGKKNSAQSSDDLNTNTNNESSISNIGSPSKRRKAKNKKVLPDDRPDIVNNDEDALFPKIVKVCSLAANSSNATANLLAKSNKKSAESENKNEEVDKQLMKRLQSTVLGEGGNYLKSYSTENGKNNGDSIGENLDDDDDEGDDTICDYPDEDPLYKDFVDSGHFLTGSAGLDSLSYSSSSTSLEGVSTQVPGLNDCTSMWDGLMNMCEVSTCSKPATKKCALCKVAFYCGEEHQKLDWKKHKNDCAPYELDCISESPESRVSAMVATRNITPGKPVFREKPLLVLPLAEPANYLRHVMDSPCIRHGGGPAVTDLCLELKPACLGCLKKLELRDCHFCSKCGLPLCSKECAFSVEHGLECSSIQDCGTSCEEFVNNCIHCIYMDVEILRALKLSCFGSANGEWQSFLRLRDHVRVESYRNTEYFTNFTRYLKTLVPYSAKVSGFNFDLIADCHSIITALSFKPALNNSFKLIFGTQLLFLHSCIPNTFHYVDKARNGSQHTMKLVTKAAVPIVKGEVITIDFVPTPYLPYRQRRKILKNLYIECRCLRCTQPSANGDHSGDIKCPQCRDGYVRAEVATDWEDSVWSCNSCQEEYPYSKVYQLETESNKLLNSIPKSRKGLDAFVEFIETQQAKFHPQHFISITAWSHIERITRKNLENVREPYYLKKYDPQTITEFQLLARYCDIMHYHLECIRNGLWIDKGIVQFLKFYAYFALASRDFQSKSITRKEYIHRVLKSMKALQDSLKHLITYYDGSEIPRYEAKLQQEGTYAYSTLKEFIGHLMMKDAAETSTTNFKSTPSSTSTNL